MTLRQPSAKTDTPKPRTRADDTSCDSIETWRDVTEPRGDQSVSPVTLNVVLNWFEELRRLVAVE